MAENTQHATSLVRSCLDIQRAKIQEDNNLKKKKKTFLEADTIIEV